MTGIEGIDGDSRREQLKNLADELGVDVDGETVVWEWNRDDR